MKNYALIKNGKVENIIVWDGVSSLTPPDGVQAVEVTEGVSIGWDYSTKLGFVDNTPEPKPEPFLPTLQEKYDGLIKVLVEKSIVTAAEIDSKLSDTQLTK